MEEVQRRTLTLVTQSGVCPDIEAALAFLFPQTEQPAKSLSVTDTASACSANGCLLSKKTEQQDLTTQRVPPPLLDPLAGSELGKWQLRWRELRQRAPAWCLADGCAAMMLYGGGLSVRQAPVTAELPTTASLDTPFLQQDKNATTLGGSAECDSKEEWDAERLRALIDRLVPLPPDARRQVAFCFACCVSHGLVKWAFWRKMEYFLCGAEPSHMACDRRAHPSARCPLSTRVHIACSLPIAAVADSPY